MRASAGCALRRLRAAMRCMMHGVACACIVSEAVGGQRVAMPRVHVLHGSALGGLMAGCECRMHMCFCRAPRRLWGC
eukprot:10252060-Alexandrium_andersonii.AAC.1